jgi:transposase-like protein
LPEASPSGSSPALDARALASLAQSRNFSTNAVRLLLRTKEMILLAKGLALGEWRESRDPVSGAFAEHCQAEVKCAELREALAIVRGRILRMPAARRKRYSPEERFRIVTFVRTYSLTLAAAGDLFMVDAQTISRWTNEAARDPDAKTIGSLLKASPPLRSTSDVTRELVALLDSLAVGGSRKIAQMLVRAGARISRETVRRFRKRKPPTLPANPSPLRSSPWSARKVRIMSG